MKKLYWYLLPLLIAIPFLFTQCNKMDVGYLKAENATYEPKSIEVYRNLYPEDIHLTEGAPWSSTRIQGVSGTNPINYEFYEVKASDGGDANAFKKAFDNGHVRVQGSVIQLFQEGVNQIPNGTYTISLKVYNEDHLQILTDIFSFVVKDEEVFDEFF